MNIAGIEAVIFDFGNTLIPFGRREVAANYAAVGLALAEMFGPCDAAALAALQDAQITAPFRNGYRESLTAALCAELVRALYGREPAPRQTARLAQARYDAFLAAVALPAGVSDCLRRLRHGYRLGFLSNYACGRTIRDSLDRIGLTPFFEAIVVSGDVGFVKPHPLPFRTVCGAMALPPEACLYVGDHWLADVQGAKNAGMKAALTTEYEPYAPAFPRPGDHEPDARIARLADLEALLA
ncbi:MAG: HAD family hydrolase [Lentisphaerae bacterium]|nr:HAD family hydrolase [Lentisphaerota bacterium]